MVDENPVALPRTVAWLGYGGLLPFLALTPASLLDHHHGAVWSDALYAYGAIILSFIGALHWGLAMSLPELTERQRSACFAWSVVPALIAWPAVLFSPPLAAPLLVFGFIAHYLQDRRLARQATLPGWYLPLRLRLTSVAVVCLIAGVFASGV
ncbi:MAG TPA: DUF3429 domain-containing protein [Azonexus sp.]|jgi:hypothetical protein|nr:DUF3429 domain-containing protein [Azonexus sp.]